MFRRALVVKLRHHGDVLLTAPLFSALAETLTWERHVDAMLAIYAEVAEERRCR